MIPLYSSRSLAVCAMTPQMFGGAGDGVTDDTISCQKAWDALANRGGGVLLIQGDFLCNLVGYKSQGVSIQGCGLSSSLSSYSANDFAVRIESDSINSAYPITFVRDVVLKDNTGAKNKHGLYANIGNGLYLDNIFFQDLGVGLFKNATYGGHHNRLRFINNYIGAFFTTVKGDNCLVEGVNNQNIMVSEAGSDSHPGFQHFNDCWWTSGTDIGVYFEQPDNIYQRESALNFQGGLIATSGPGLVFTGEQTNHNVCINQMWFEGSLMSKSVRGMYLPARYIYSECADLAISNSTISDIEIKNKVICCLDNCTLGGNYISSGRSMFFGRNCIGDDINVDFHIDGGKNYTDSREFCFLTVPKTNIGKSFAASLVASNTCLPGSVLPTGWGQLASDGIFPISGCIANTIAAQSSSRVAADLDATSGKIFILTFAIKNTAAETSDGYISFPSGAGKFVLTNKWKSFCIICSSAGVPSTEIWYSNTTSAEQCIRISGFQLLAFDNYTDANAAVRSESFSVAD